MGRSYKSGRGYWDPERMSERYAKAQLQYAEGRARGGSGGGGGGPRGGGGQLPQMPKMPFSPEDMADQSIINFGNAPTLGQDYAQSLARTQYGLGTISDFGLMQQRNNPSVAPEVNMAAARQRFRRTAWLNNGGLMGAAQQALLG